MNAGFEACERVMNARLPDAQRPPRIWPTCGGRYGPTGRRKPCAQDIGSRSGLLERKVSRAPHFLTRDAHPGRRGRARRVRARPAAGSGRSRRAGRIGPVQNGSRQPSAGRSAASSPLRSPGRAIRRRAGASSCPAGGIGCRDRPRHSHRRDRLPGSASGIGQRDRPAVRVPWSPWSVRWTARSRRPAVGRHRRPSAWPRSGCGSPRSWRSP